MSDEEKKKPEPEPQEADPKLKDPEKRKDLIVDITDQVPPGSAGIF